MTGPPALNVDAKKAQWRDCMILVLVGWMIWFVGDGVARSPRKTPQLNQNPFVVGAASRSKPVPNCVTNNLLLKQEDAEAILRFIHNPNPDMSIEESVQAIKDCVVEITQSNREHHANGLLITQNGYFVTCAHCLSKNNTMWLRTHDNRKFRIVPNRYISNDIWDFALSRVRMPGKPAPCKYKFSALGASAVKNDFPVTAFICRYEMFNAGALLEIKGWGNRDFQHPMIYDDKSVVGKAAFYRMISYPGYSGSTIINRRGMAIATVDGYKTFEDGTRKMVAISLYNGLLFLEKEIRARMDLER